jgi:hypothetical protein
MSTLCPDIGRLRGWLDHEAAVADDALDDAIDNHVDDCTACQTVLGSLIEDADVAGRALGTGVATAPSAEQTEQALARLHRRLASGDAEPLPTKSVEGVSTGAAPARAMAGSVTHDAPTESIGAVARFSEAVPAAPPPMRALTPALSQGERESTTAPRRRIPMPITAVWQRGRLALGGLAAAVALTLALATPEGQAVAATFLAQFRSQRLAIVTFDPNQARQTGLFRLERLGAVQNNRPPEPVTVASVQEAANRAGFPIVQPDPATLPVGASKTPKVRFSPSSETRLTFDRQKARAYFDSINRKDLSLPDRLNGATLVVALPPVVMLEYSGADNKPSVMIGQAREIQVGVEGGASLEEVRNFLLGLPDLPPDLARQLRSIQDWTSTLPIPIPVDKMTWQETTIDGAQAYMLNDNTGLGSGVIWQRDGRILGVAGPMKATDLRKIAESLR